MAGFSPLLVAAIDFGTTYSGWGFSFKHTYKIEPTNVSMKVWTGPSQVASYKTATCALITPNGEKLVAFGYDAETMYANGGNLYKGFYLFRRFKMHLWKENVNRDMKIEDVTGKALSAMTVFSLSLRFLKDQLLNDVSMRINGEISQDIRWVLTVPAIWKDCAKQFMREAAQNAGIPKERLLIALESEVASIYCRHLPVEKSVAKDSFSQLKTGTRYLVLDAGGGTVDITVHEISENGCLRELSQSTGGNWGGTQVDDAFIKFLSDLVGSDVLNQIKTVHSDDYLDLVQAFETEKRNVSPDKNTKITIRIPLKFKELVEELRGKSLLGIVKKSKFSEKIELVSDKLRFDAAIVKTFFSKPVSSILDHVRALLGEPENKGIKAIVLVGGFSDSPMLHRAFIERYPGIKIIIPGEAVLAVMKGAVMFGHNPMEISPRIMKLTYGVQMQLPFDEDRHPAASRVVEDDGSEWCRDTFSKHVEAGQSVYLSEISKPVRYYAANPHSKSMSIKLYSSPNKDPVCVTDPGCALVGTIKIPLDGHGRDRAVDVGMVFGGTEVEVQCTELATRKQTVLKVDFLSGGGQGRGSEGRLS